MIQSLRQIKRRIRSIENTEKITHALEMIASSRLKGLQDKQSASRAFFGEVENIFKNISAIDAVNTHPFFRKKPGIQKVSLCLISSDSGLCGSYNENIIRALYRFIEVDKNLSIDILAIGRVGSRYFKRKNFSVTDLGMEWRGHYSVRDVDILYEDLLTRFLQAQSNAIYVAYTFFDSASRLRPVVEKLLPMEKSSSKPVEYIMEADQNSVLERFLPFYLRNRLRWMVLNSLVSEHTARGIAMAEATDNAKELLEGLILLRNKVRQANITKEIIEVISSVEALKG